MQKNKNIFIASDHAGFELKTVGRILKEKGSKTKEDTKEYHQLKKYLEALKIENGLLINFPFPPEKRMLKSKISKNSIKFLVHEGKKINEYEWFIVIN